jgi:hypothetical protein
VWIDEERKYLKYLRSNRSDRSSVTSNRPTSVTTVPEPLSPAASPASPMPLVDIRPTLRDSRPKSQLTGRKSGSRRSSVHQRESSGVDSLDTASEGRRTEYDGVERDLSGAPVKMNPQDNLSIKTTESEEDIYPSPWRIGIIFFCLSIANFFVGLDRTIVSTAMYYRFSHL